MTTFDIGNVGEFANIQAVNVCFPKKSDAEIINNIFKLLKDCKFALSYIAENDNGYAAHKCRQIGGTMRVERDASRKLNVRMDNVDQARANHIALTSKKVFLILEKAWQFQQIEMTFGYSPTNLLVLDRVVRFISRERVERPFQLPEQQIVLCQASEHERLATIYMETVGSLKSVTVCMVTNGNEAYQAIEENADTVVFTTNESVRKFITEKIPFPVPVISVSKVEQTHEGMLMALRVLAIKNPLVYMYLALAQEAKFKGE